MWEQEGKDAKAMLGEKCEVFFFVYIQIHIYIHMNINVLMSWSGLVFEKPKISIQKQR